MGDLLRVCHIESRAKAVTALSCESAEPRPRVATLPLELVSMIVQLATRPAPGSRVSEAEAQQAWENTKALRAVHSSFRDCVERSRPDLVQRGLRYAGSLLGEKQLARPASQLLLPDSAYEDLIGFSQRTASLSHARVIALPPMLVWQHERVAFTEWLRVGGATGMDAAELLLASKACRQRYRVVRSVVETSESAHGLLLNLPKRHASCLEHSRQLLASADAARQSPYFIRFFGTTPNERPCMLPAYSRALFALPLSPWLYRLDIDSVPLRIPGEAASLSHVLSISALKELSCSFFESFSLDPGDAHLTLAPFARRQDLLRLQVTLSLSPMALHQNRSQLVAAMGSCLRHLHSLHYFGCRFRVLYCQHLQTSAAHVQELLFGVGGLSLACLSLRNNLFEPRALDSIAAWAPLGRSVQQLDLSGTMLSQEAVEFFLARLRQRNVTLSHLLLHDTEASAPVAALLRIQRSRPADPSTLAAAQAKAKRFRRAIGNAVRESYSAREAWDMTAAQQDGKESAFLLELTESQGEAESWRHW